MLETQWQLKEKSSCWYTNWIAVCEAPVTCVCFNGSANLAFCIVNILKLCCSSLETCCSIIQALVTNRSLQIRHAPSDLEGNEKKTKFLKNVHLYHGLKLMGGVLSASIIFWKNMMNIFQNNDGCIDIEQKDPQHWGRVTHICVSKLTTIGSDNGLSPGQRQAIIWTNAGILLIRPSGANFS